MRRGEAIRTGLRRRGAGIALALVFLAGCEGYGGIAEPIDGSRHAPALAEPRYRWVESSWRGTQPVGHPAVELQWELPGAWRGEVFRVHAKRSEQAGYGLAATVTSCAADVCRYTDLNVAPGRSYDYYVAAVDERSGRESGASSVRRIRIPEAAPPSAPTPVARALDGAVFLEWRSTGAERYRVFLERVGSDSTFFEIGATDGTGYVDTRAENGKAYGYRIAAVDTLGHVSERSVLVAAIPRPDYHSELIYSLADSAAASGFRFVASEGEDPILAGTAAGAQWRMETGLGAPRIVPLGATRVTRGTFTTALACGPGSERDCVAVEEAPAASAFGAAPVPVEVGNSYVFRVRGADGRTHYGKIRVQGRGTDARGLTVVVFDWAYQLRPDEPRLSTERG